MSFSRYPFLFIFVFMSTQNASFKIRNRSVEIKWISQYCDHILDNYLNKNNDHDLKFQQIANLLKTCKFSN